MTSKKEGERMKEKREKRQEMENPGVVGTWSGYLEGSFFSLFFLEGRKGRKKEKL